MSLPFLSIRDVTKTYGSVTAVEGVSLDIERGEFVTFLGPSGSGKSTTLYAIAGFLEPTRGDVVINGSSLLRKPPNKRGIGMVFQRYTLFPHLSVFENVAFPLRVRRRPSAEIEAKVRQMLALVRLEGMADRKPSALSGGQQQRVALARALAYDPPLLLMDEPLSALDRMLRSEIQTEIKRIHRETGVTILYVTHDQEEALNLSDRVALFNMGRLEQVDTGRNLYEQPTTRFTASFIGESNFFKGTFHQQSDGYGSVTLPDGRKLACNGIGRHIKDGETVSLMVRPDHLSAKAATATPGVGLVGTLKEAIFLGEYYRLSVETSWGASLTAKLTTTQAKDAVLEVGTEMALVCEPNRIHLF